MQSADIGKLAEALAKAQAEMNPAKKDSINPFFKSSYADLASIWEACRIPLTKNGLCVIQTIEIDSFDGTNRNFILVTKLAHLSGQWVFGSYPVNPLKQDPQSFGSAVTYARRYSLMAIVGIAPEEDDGEASQGRQVIKSNHEKPSQPSQADYPPRQLSDNSPPTEKQQKKLFAMLKAAEKDPDWLRGFMETKFGESVVDFETGQVSTSLLTQGQLQLIYLELDKAVQEKTKK